MDFTHCPLCGQFSLSLTTGSCMECSYEVLLSEDDAHNESDFQPEFVESCDLALSHAGMFDTEQH